MTSRGITSSIDRYYDDVFADVEARYAETFSRSRVVVEFHPSKSGGSGVFHIRRVWPSNMNCKPVTITHTGSRIIANKIAAEFREMDRAAQLSTIIWRTQERAA